MRLICFGQSQNIKPPDKGLNTYGAVLDNDTILDSNPVFCSMKIKSGIWFKTIIVSTKILPNLSINSVVVKLSRILLAGPLEATQNELELVHNS
jgi:hypothetical protein